MLLRFQTFTARGLLAEMQKPADLETKVCQGTILVMRQSACSPEYIVTRYDLDPQFFAAANACLGRAKDN
jgi:hypothetical protein